jgi:hypothetical protein
MKGLSAVGYRLSAVGKKAWLIADRRGPIAFFHLSH